MFNKVINELIPFVILEAHPDNKRPYVLPFYGMIDEDKLYDILLQKLVEFVYDRIDIKKLNSVDDIKQFWKEFYTDSYMDNPPWQATAIVNGIWDDINISDEDLFKALLDEKNKNKNYISSEDENYENIEDDNDTVESIIINDINEDSEELLMEKILEEVYDV